MTISDILMIFAVLLAPLVAVHVQKRLEYFREQRQRKMSIFKTLMATRAATVSIEHVQALNMIDLEFQGGKYNLVRDAWRTYLDHLASFPKEDQQKERQVLWAEKNRDLLARLLIEMGKSLGYSFDEVHVKKGIYSPQAHAQQEEEQILLRRGLLAMIFGDRAVRMEVTRFPYDEEAVEEQRELWSAMKRVLSGEQAIQVMNQVPDKDQEK